MFCNKGGAVDLLMESSDRPVRILESKGEDIGAEEQIDRFEMISDS